MSKQMLYIITGLPYAGKTTLVNELVKRFNLTVCSVDEVLDEEKWVVEKMKRERNLEANSQKHEYPL